MSSRVEIELQGRFSQALASAETADLDQIYEVASQLFAILTVQESLGSKANTAMDRAILEGCLAVAITLADLLAAPEEFKAIGVLAVGVLIVLTAVQSGKAQILARLAKTEKESYGKKYAEELAQLQSQMVYLKGKFGISRLSLLQNKREFASAVVDAYQVVTAQRKHALLRQQFHA